MKGLMCKSRFELANEYYSELEGCFECISDTGGVANPELFPHMFDEKFMKVNDTIKLLKHIRARLLFCKQTDSSNRLIKSIIKQLGGKDVL